MTSNKSFNLKILSGASFLLLIISLALLAILGRYSHALGDDFYYGYTTKLAYDNGNIFNALIEACKGVNLQFHRWQGTYSAMFLMYLPPQIFGDFFYKLYPTVLLTCLTSGFFYMLKPVICHYLKQGREHWLFISSIIVFLAVEQVPVMGEAFYWYNGSMYYTGFYACTLFFFGGIIRFLIDNKTHRIITLALCGLFLAGGNYASLLPSIIILFTILAFSIIKKKPKKEIFGLSIIIVSILTGFSISVLAPGNALRQDTSYGTTPIKAVLKSLLQGLSFLKGWSNIWLFLALIILTPIFIRIIKDSSFSFKYPLIVCIYAFGIFASASCPTFYAQNNGGAARVFDLSWYSMVLYVTGAYFYLLGWYIKRFDRKTLLVSELSVVVLFFIMLFIRPFSETYIPLNSISNAKAIINGDAKYYETQYEERVQIINSEVQDMVFKPYDVPESLNYVLYLGDLNSDPEFFSNQSFAAFYHKKSVYVSEE